MVDAAADLGPADAYSARGYRRLQRFAGQLARLRARMAQPLPDLIADLEAAPPPPALIPARGRVHRNADYAARQDARESNARTYARKLRLAIVKAQGVRVTDADGRSYYDCLGAAGTLVLGHNHPQVSAAVRQAIDDGIAWQTLDMATPAKDAFTQALFDSLPPTFADRARVQFCSPSGSDAIEAALKLTRTATGRASVLAFAGGYHGMTQGALALMGNLGPKQLPGLLPGAQFLPYPYAYRCPFETGGAQTARLSAAAYRLSYCSAPKGLRPSFSATIALPSACALRAAAASCSRRLTIASRRRSRRTMRASAVLVASCQRWACWAAKTWRIDSGVGSMAWLRG